MIDTRPPVRFWTPARLAAIALSLLVAAVFVGANAHLIAVAFASQPDCVAPPESAAPYRAAKPSC